jgi:hypothetical protein
MKSQKNKFPLEPKVNWWRLPEEVDALSKVVDNLGSNQGPAGPQGIQGPAGPQGALGPVGPAGLEWQGLWDADTAYAADDAVAFNGASWFCISPVTGTGNTDPETDTVHWALLAAQGAQGQAGAVGAQGPEGPQGPAGTAPVKTQGLIFGGVNGSPAVLSNDINILQLGAGSGSMFILPNTTVVGKEIIVSSGNGNSSYIYAHGLGATLATTYNTSTSQLQVEFNQYYKFTSLGTNFWAVEALQRSPVLIGGKAHGNGTTYPLVAVNTTTTTLNDTLLNNAYPDYFNIIGLTVYCPNILNGATAYIKTGLSTWTSKLMGFSGSSTQVTANDTPTNFSGVGFVRIFASAGGKGIKLTETPRIGRAIYLKNTSNFDVNFSILNENVNGNSSVDLKSNSYYLLLKEDSGTNSTTLFRLTEDRARDTIVDYSSTTPTLATLTSLSTAYWPIGCKILFPNISGGPTIYLRTNIGEWFTMPATAVV